MKLTRWQKNLAALVERSKDLGGGWRQVGNSLWPSVEGWAAERPDVFDLDAANKRIKLTDAFIAAQRFM